MLARLERLEDAALVTEYRSWLERSPKMTAGLIYAAKRREQEEQQAIIAYLRQSGTEAE
jgi:hypothetical protein